MKTYYAQRDCPRCGKKVRIRIIDYPEKELFGECVSCGYYFEGQELKGLEYFYCDVWIIDDILEYLGGEDNDEEDI